MRTKLLIVFTCIYLAATQQAFSQNLYIGPKIGMNVVKATNGGEEMSSIVGGNIGAFIQAKLNKTISIQGEVLYSQQGFEVEVWEETGSLFTSAKQKMNYINIPVLMKVYAYNSFNVMVGPQIGFLVDSELIGLNSNALYNKVDFSAVLGVGYDFPFGLTIDARYCPSFTNLVKKEFTENGENGKNYVFQISTGWKFKIK